MRYVYGLRTKTSPVIHYVGQSADPVKRLEQHFKQILNQNPRLRDWLQATGRDTTNISKQRDQSARLALELSLRKMLSRMAVKNRNEAHSMPIL